MTNQEFDILLNSRIEKIKSVLQSKAKEYAKTDRLHNFKIAAEINKQTPERALWGMFMKHFVSVKDLVDDLETIPILPNEKVIDEKIGDAINYLILLEALFIERLKKARRDNAKI